MKRQPLVLVFTLVVWTAASLAADPPTGRIVLQPQAGAMQVTAVVPGFDNQAFASGIPETIGCREAMLVNFPEAKIEWRGPDAEGVVSCSWGPGGRIQYMLRLCSRRRQRGCGDDDRQPHRVCLARRVCLQLC